MQCWVLFRFIHFKINYFLGLSVGKITTSLIFCVFVSNITNLSIPIPSPAAGGIPYSIASKYSSSLGETSLSPFSYCIFRTQALYCLLYIPRLLIQESSGLFVPTAFYNRHTYGRNLIAFCSTHHLSVLQEEKP